MAIFKPDLSNGYSGSVSQFVELMFKLNHISAANLVAWHEDIVDYFKSSQPTYISRTWMGKKRGHVQAFEADRSCNYIVSDNTSAIWSYVRAQSGQAAGNSRPKDADRSCFAGRQETTYKVSPYQSRSSRNHWHYEN